MHSKCTLLVVAALFAWRKNNGSTLLKAFMYNAL